MLQPGRGGARIYLAVGATDLRKSFDGLCGLVQSQMQLDASSGNLFVFCNQNRTRIKALYFDGSGLWVCAKRLEKGRFSWPKEGGEKCAVELSQAELFAILEGLDLSHAEMKSWWRKKAHIEENSIANR